MTSTLLVLLLLSRAEGPDTSEGAGVLREGAFATVGQGVEHAR
ncbi:hypothetical protein [Archangium sp.]|nr:hypothetical protein [Archangium sp.]